MSKIKAKVKRVNLGLGFWSIEDEKGNKYEVLDMPHQLRKNGMKTDVWIKVRKDVSTNNMYGTPIEIVGFTT